MKGAFSMPVCARCLIINWDLCLKLCMKGVHNYRDMGASGEGVDP